MTRVLASCASCITCLPLFTVSAGSRTLSRSACGDVVMPHPFQRHSSPIRNDEMQLGSARTFNGKRDASRPRTAA